MSKSQDASASVRYSMKYHRDSRKEDALDSHEFNIFIPLFLSSTQQRQEKDRHERHSISTFIIHILSTPCCMRRNLLSLPLFSSKEKDEEPYRYTWFVCTFHNMILRYYLCSLIGRRHERRQLWKERCLTQKTLTFCRPAGISLIQNFLSGWHQVMEHE